MGRLPDEVNEFDRIFGATFGLDRAVMAAPAMAGFDAEVFPSGGWCRD
jgi:hypothetical protein